MYPATVTISTIESGGVYRSILLKGIIPVCKEFPSVKNSHL